MRAITVEKYDEAWPEEFKKIRGVLYPQIDDLIVDIIHVGSTSVPGLPSKPVIDVNVVIESCDGFAALSKRLGALGYVHEGNGGVEGRETFRKEKGDAFMDCLVHVCPKDGEELRRQIAFRDYMRAHPEDAETYGILKSYLAIRFPYDVDGYVTGKSGFVEKIVEAAKSEGLYGDL
ncbi:MAG: GrpB family protein [Methanomassiliicoccaceae archaeon]|nr:GrpB family protein [Methanomassiliicoccaceae archaeon]